MHAIHPDPLRLLAALGAALVLTAAALALPPSTSDLDLRLGGGAEAQPAPALVRTTPAEPRWVTDPLSPPSPVAR